MTDTISECETWINLKAAFTRNRGTLSDAEIESFVSCVLELMGEGMLQLDCSSAASVLAGIPIPMERFMELVRRNGSKVRVRADSSVNN